MFCPIARKPLELMKAFPECPPYKICKGYATKKSRAPSTLSVINTEMLTTCAAVAHALGVLDVQIPF